MRYLGGKTRIAKQLAEVIDRTRKPGQLVWDAFCGGLSMSVALSKNGPVRSTDANAAVISLYQAVQSGWRPPTTVTREQRDAALLLPDTDPLKAFLRIGCGFAGNWSSGFADRYPNGKTYAAESASSLVKTVDGRFLFECVDFLSEEPPRPVNFVLYLDPPYAGTTGYAGTGAFNADEFYSRAAAWAAHADVFVSEYQLPIGIVVWEGVSRTQVANNHGASKAAVERLYHIPKGSHWPGYSPESTRASATEQRTTEGRKHMAAVKIASKIGSKAAPKAQTKPARPRVSAVAAAMAAAEDVGSGRPPEFEPGDHIATFNGLAERPHVPGHQTWIDASFTDAEGTQREVRFCTSAKALDTTGKRLKNLCKALVGVPSVEEYNAFDPHGEFLDGLLGFLETFEATVGEEKMQINPSEYVGTKLRVIAVQGNAVLDKETGEAKAGEFYVNCRFESVDAEESAE